MEAGQRGKSDGVSKVERDYSSSQKKEGGGVRRGGRATKRDKNEL